MLTRQLEISYMLKSLKRLWSHIGDIIQRFSGISDSYKEPTDA